MAMQITRRTALQSAACGFGYLALQGLLAKNASAAAASISGAARGIANPLLPRQPHFAPRAKRVIFLFMQGGVSHVDSYDYKPTLDKQDGKSMPFDDARQVANTGTRGASHRVMKSLWQFRQHGQTGRW